MTLKAMMFYLNVLSISPIRWKASASFSSTQQRAIFYGNMTPNYQHLPEHLNTWC